MASKTSKPLGLRIKRHWLEEIVAGRKKIEYRDFTEHYIARFATIEDVEGGQNVTVREDIKFLRLYVSSKEYVIVQRRKIDIDNASENSDDWTFNLHIGKIIEDKSKARLKSTPKARKGERP